MLFNSYEFLLFFLPIALAGWFLCGRWAGHRCAQVWLVAASLFYYGWWNPWYLILIVSLTVFNYNWGRLLARRAAAGRSRGLALALGLVVNLGVLGYYKYANFFLDNLHSLLGTDWVLGKIILPLGISFFTFQKIGYLVDCSRGLAPKGDFLSFALFVVFFPQLIAGPIVHHGEIIPQFARPDVTQPRWINLALGLTTLTFGLAKKVLLADPLAARIGEAFDATAVGHHVPFGNAWYAVLAYALQIYFDFSGYTDMAIGLARLFNIILPQNFNSPYQSANIVEFWRRWHMTLSRFLRDYLYIPLGGNRHGRLRQRLNLIITMLLGGLWHGANWTFVVWGLLHGLYLVLNHGWLEFKVRLTWLARVPRPLRGLAAHGLTLSAVMLAWVLFRAVNFSSAVTMLETLCGHGLPQVADGLPVIVAVKPERWLWLALLGLVVLFAPNSQNICSRFQPVLGVTEPSRHPGLFGGRLQWRPTTAWAVYIAVVFAASFLSLSTVSEFLYYQF
jgi:D-alanyl-lipoteichoic acid acyltransferase DltB (MBOAT superfamily)